MDDIETHAAGETIAPAKKHGGGWPKGKSRNARPDVRAEPTRDAVRTRKRKGGTLQDKFELPADMLAHFKAKGISVEWKREITIGQNDPGYDVYMREQGWLPVDGRDWPEFVANGHVGPIRRDGMILMERPIELTKEAMAEDRAAARNAVAIKEEQLRGAPEGQFQRQRDDGSSTVRVNRTIESGGMEID